MSNPARRMKRERARAAHRKAVDIHKRASEITATLSEQHGFVVGWCDDTDETLEEAKRQTHDAVIEMLGRYRTGPVEWKIWTDPVATQVLERLTSTEDSETMLLHYRRLRAMLREYGGRLVMALAPGDRVEFDINRPGSPYHQQEDTIDG